MTLPDGRHRRSPAARDADAPRGRRRSSACRSSSVLASQRRRSPAASPSSRSCSASIALVAYVVRLPDARRAIDRARLQWAGWGVVVAASIVLAIVLMHVLVGWPDALGAPLVVATDRSSRSRSRFASFDRLALRIDRLLVRTIEVGGLVVLVGVVYVVVVLGFGETPDRRAAAACSACRWSRPRSRRCCSCPARNWLEEAANRRVVRRPPGARRAAADVRRPHVARDPARRAAAPARGVAEEEHAARRGRGVDRHRRRARAGRGGAVPRAERGAAQRGRGRGRRARPRLGQRVDPGVAAGVPRPAPGPGAARRAARALGRAARPRRVRAHRRRSSRSPTKRSGCSPSSPARSRSRCTTRRSTPRCRRRSTTCAIANEELRASRARIVATADQSRRQIERNLHDGAQQHLVALAVKLGLARQLVDADPRRARRRCSKSCAATRRRRSPSCASSRTASTRRC